MAMMATSQVELHVSCFELKSLDLFSKSDPFVVLFSVQNGNKVEIGRTETLVNTPTGAFTTSFLVDFFFDEVQTFCMEVYDEDGKKGDDLSHHDFIGGYTFTISALMTSSAQSLKGPLIFKKKNKRGDILIRGEETSICSDMISMQWKGVHLDKKNGIFRKSDPFLRFLRSREDGTYVQVDLTETISNDVNPKWKKRKIKAQTLSNGDYQRPIRIECMDWEKNGEHKLIGVVDTSLQELTEGRKELPLVNAARKQKKGNKYTNSGVLYLESIQVYKVPTFLEHVRGGMEINLMIAIDYTASNGAPSTPSSLHFMNPTAYNQYQMAIHSTVDILQEYDHDRRFPLYGFGGQVNGTISHCFPLTFDINAAEVEGLEGILNAYRNSFNFVSLSGPTLFAPILNAAAAIAASYASLNKYLVLLILTDGVIMDMSQTVDAIVRATHLPLSIVIVGVGNADFSAMDALDADDGALQASDGQKASRDIVQFVPFNKFQLNAARLAKETLAEIPNQVVQYMVSHNIQPGPIPVAPTNAMFPTMPEASAPPAPIQHPQQNYTSGV